LTSATRSLHHPLDAAGALRGKGGGWSVRSGRAAPDRHRPSARPTPG
jgi:hypothetical protein